MVAIAVPFLVANIMVVRTLYLNLVKPKKGTTMETIGRPHGRAQGQA